MNPPSVSETVDALVVAFENLSPDKVQALDHWYAPDARFKDPFKEVQGIAAIEAIFVHMFDSLHEPRFVVTERIVQGSQCFLVWDFVFRFKTMDSQTVQCIRGGSHLQFAPHTNGSWRITLHRDYWDAAEELYEKLPLVGGLMRWLKKRVNA
ncbi:MAG: nuclear transport factor 2 family protein [Betaproteobacteria bacterium]|nr:nuclear transport factor 2 family protein [Betaproteobacteria bacterium]